MTVAAARDDPRFALAPNAWREPGTDVFTFQSDVFGEAWEEGGGKRKE